MKRTDLQRLIAQAKAREAKRQQFYSSPIFVAHPEPASFAFSKHVLAMPKVRIRKVHFRMPKACLSLPRFSFSFPKISITVPNISIKSIKVSTISPRAVRDLLRKPAFAIPLVTAMVLVTVLVLPPGQVNGASFTFVQSSWAGGLDGGTNPSHPANETGWTKYSAKDSTVTAGSTVTLAQQAGSNTQTSQADFNAGTLSSVTASSSGDLTLTGSLASPPAWSQTTLVSPPSARQIGAFAWDSTDNKLLIFGGYSGSFLNDLWSYVPTTNTWTQLSPTGGPPGTRTAASGVWDPVDNKFWLTGGGLTDLWSYSPSTNTWTQASPTGGPPPARSYFQAVWDSTDNELLEFGGWTGSVYLGDLWAYKPSTNTWTELSASGGASARYGAAAAWDPVDNKMLIFGGYNGTYQGDFWSYAPSTNTWASLGTGPEAKTFSEMAWDSSNNRAWLFGGRVGAYDQTLWYYTPSNNTWTSQSVFGGSSPPGREIHSFVWDTQANKLRMFGGFEQSATYLNDFWSLSPSQYTQHVGTFTSQAIDTGGNVGFGTLNFTSSVPANTTLKFQIRSASTSGGLASATFHGPTGTGDYYTSSGTQINSAENGNRWVQFQATLGTSVSDSTPILSDVTINYNYYPASATITSSAYDTSAAANVLALLQWSATTPTNTSVKFQVRTAPNSGGVPGAWSSWCGPDNGAAGCSSSTYFTDSTGGQAIDADFKDSVNDEFVQWMATLATTDGSVAPTLNSVTVTYVVNANPVVSSVTASQGSNGSVTIGYTMADSDNSTETVAVAADLGITLSSPITNSATSLNVSDSSKLPSSGSIFIDNEEISYASNVSNTLSGLTRGVNNSVAVAHSGSVPVLFKAKTVTGDVGASVATGTGKSIIWTAATDVPGVSSSSVTVKVFANDGNAANQQGSAQSAVFSLDTTAPTVGTSNNVRSAATSDSTVTITWTTNKASTSVVDYGTTTSYGLTASDNTLVTSHTINLTGLAANTTYFFRVKSIDAVSNILIDDNGGAGYSFTTPNIIAGRTIEASDTTPPLITNVQVSGLTSNSAQITWTTDEVASSFIYYGGTTAYGSLAGSPDVFVTDHSVTVSGLAAQTTYNYQVVSLDKSGNRSATDNATFTTTDVSGSGGSTAPAAGTGTATGSSGDLSTDLQNEISSLQAQQQADEQQINDLQAQLTNSAGLSTDQYNAIKSELGGLQEQLVETNGKLLAAQQQLDQYQTLADKYNADEQKIADLQGKLDDITNNILGIKNGDTMSPEDLLKVVVARFQSLAITLKSNPTVAQQDLSSTISDANTTLKDLTNLVPGPKILVKPTVDLASNQATITWSTDQPASSQVSFADDATYKNSQKYSATAGDATESVTDHSVILDNLLPSTTYHYQISSTSQSGASTTSQDFTFTTKTELPVISSARIEKLSDTSAKVSWNTSVPTNSAVIYAQVINGTVDTQNSKTVGAPELTTTHVVELDSLLQGQTYDIQISSSDAYNNVVTQKLGSFVTGQDTTPPNITELRPQISIIPDPKQSTIQAIITWKTDEPATTQVVFTKGQPTDEKFNDQSELNPEYTYSHTVVITNWDQGSLYSFKAVSKDQSGNEARSKTYTVRTPQQQGTVIDVIVNNFSDVFGWTKKIGQ